MRLMLVIAIFISILWVIGASLSREYSFETSIHINAPSDEVFAKLNDLRQWQDWSYWGQGESLNVQFAGEPIGVGSIQTWDDPRGNGKLWITESVPSQLVKYKMYSGGFPEQDSQFDIETTDDSVGSKVTWSSKGSLPKGAFYGYFSFLFGPAMKAEYGRGLTKLKTVLESD